MIALLLLNALAKATELAPPAANTPAAVPVAATATIHGQLLEKGTRKPLTGVNVYCFIPEDNEVPQKAVTDSKGNFHLSVALPSLVTKVRWRVALSNYRIFEQSEALDPAHVLEEKFYLEKQSYLTYETTVISAQEKRDAKTKTLTQDEFLTLPGANGDPVKAVQNLPGVNRGNAFDSQVIIEGSAPEDTRYSIDTQEVPIIFHFSGLSSVVIPEAVDHIDYLSAGFGPEYGQSMAGVINLTTKDPQTDRWHAFAFVDIFNVGGMVEGPLSDSSSLLVGFRQSYIGFVLGQLAKGQPDFNLTVAPDFRDLVLEYKNKISATDSFKVVSVASSDTLGFVLPEPTDFDPSLRGNFNLNTTFYRIIPQYTHQFDSDTTGRVWLGFGQDSIVQNFGTLYFDQIGPVASTRVELEQQLAPAWKSYVGLDDYMSWPSINFQTPFDPSTQTGSSIPIGASALQTVNSNYFLNDAAVYWRNVVHFSDSRWTYLPGLRVDAYNQTKETLPQPRFAVKYAMDRGLTWRAATGLYSQAPPPQDLDSNYGNPALISQSAIHFTVGAEKDFKQGNPVGWLLSSDVFYKTLYNLVETTGNLNAAGQPLYYNNNGTGKAYGLEMLMKYQGTQWNGWLAYTLSRSTRTYPPLSEQLFQYDQTHNLTLVADKKYGRNEKFSFRMRYTTGDPYTPDIGGNLDVDNDVYLPISGAPYSQRMNSFFEMDIRVDKKWIYPTWILTAYLDIENITNQQNPQQIIYSYNYQQQANINGLPILPTIGVKGEM